MRCISAACRALCLAAGLGASAGAGAAVAAAESVVDVARATVRLPAGEWLSLARSTVDAVRVNDQRSIPAEVLTLALVHDQQLDALVTITVTAGGAGGLVSWTSSCEAPEPGIWSARPVGADPSDMECAYASAAFAPDDFFSESTDWGREARSRGLRAPDEMVLASAVVGSRMGSWMSVEVLASADFAGDQGPLSGVDDADVPSGVDDRHAAYAVQLLNRVRDCIYSMRGRMDFPPIHFIPAAPAEARIARLDL